MTYASAVMDEDDLTALEFLNKYKDEIHYIHLVYTWSHQYISELPDLYLEYRGETIPCIAALFEANDVDEEYCFSGTPEEAVKFFENYGIWDGELFPSMITDGVLIAQYDNDVWISEDPDEFDPAHHQYLDVETQGLAYYSGSRWCSVAALKGARICRISERDSE